MCISHVWKNLVWLFTDINGMSDLIGNLVGTTRGTTRGTEQGASDNERT